MAAEKTIDAYILGLGDWRGEIVAAPRHLIREAAPETRESIKWAQPVFESHGPFAYIKAFPRQVNFGFWRGADLDDPEGLLIGDGDRMRHVTITAPDQMRPDVFTAWVRQAVALNAAKGDPTRNR